MDRGAPLSRRQLAEPTNAGREWRIDKRSIDVRDLRGKVAWITGAGSGIGEAAAVALGKAGMRIALSGRRPEPLAQVKSRIPGSITLPLDVADKRAVAAARDEVLAAFGRVDVLVNSAGLNVRNRNWHNVTLEDWDLVIRADLDGAFYCSKAVLPTMIAQRDGLIVNVSSWAGKYTSILTGPGYSAAKHAMNSMTESLNMEAGIHGIRACALCPGEVATPILDKRPVPVTAEEKAQMVQPEDCGEIIHFLAAMPMHVCINELTVSPTWNRGFVAQAKAIQQL
jgi:NADP-dependent 3-hydroxy acid dehydrogenase YdfG